MGKWVRRTGVLPTAIPDDSAHAGSFEDAVERWNGWPKSLSREVDRAEDCAALECGQTHAEDLNPVGPVT